MESQRSKLPDWAYPSEDMVPETTFHLRLRTSLYLLVRHYLTSRGVRAFTGSEQFLYWVEDNPQQAVAPDLYVVLDDDPDREPRVWRTWVEGRAPDLVLEIVSNDLDKDYVLAPTRYGRIGVRELVVFDPFEGPSRVRWQVFRRGQAGDWVLAASTDADRVESVVLGCFLRWVTPGPPARRPEPAPGSPSRRRADLPADVKPEIRLAVGPEGDELVPTEVEAAHAATARERLDKEREIARRVALEAELAALRARLGAGDD